MSRLGKVPVSIPKNVKVNYSGDTVHVEGPKGKLALTVPRGLKLEVKDDKIHVARESNLKQNKANQGTVVRLLESNIIGVVDGHKKDLEIQGVGFRAQVQGQKLSINLGFSHPVELDVPKDIKVSAAKPTEISVEGIDKAKVGLIAAKIRDLKRPEPYKGKGIRYVGEVVRRKQGKSVTK